MELTGARHAETAQILRKSLALAVEDRFLRVICLNREFDLTNPHPSDRRLTRT